MGSDSATFQQLADVVIEVLSRFRAAHERCRAALERHVREQESLPECERRLYDSDRVQHPNVRVDITDKDGNMKTVEIPEAAYCQKDLIRQAGTLSLRLSAYLEEHSNWPDEDEKGKQFWEATAHFFYTAEYAECWAFVPLANEDEDGFQDDDEGFCDAAEKLIDMCKQLQADMERDVGLLVDQERFEVRWRGKTCRLGNTQEFWLMQALAESAGKFIPRDTLAERIGRKEERPIKHIKSRLTKALTSAGMKAVADSIRADLRHYGLFPSGIVTVL